MTTPSVALGPPGNCAYPSKPPESGQTQRLRCDAGVTGAIPPVEAFFTPPSVVNAVFAVWVCVTLTSLNWMRASATRPFHGVGVPLLSALVARESLFIAAI